MRRNLESYPEVISFGGTYRVNIENQALWAALVMDGDGVGQPIAFGYLSNAQDKTISNYFFNWFATDNLGVTKIARAISVDKVKEKVEFSRGRFCVNEEFLR